MVRPIVLQDFEVVEFYKSINPKKDFPYKRPPISERIDNSGGLKNKHISGSPLAFKLVERYVDLGAAIKKGQWRRAYQIYRYLQKMLTN